jgi:hypothetical protein
MLGWSKGLRDKLGMADEISDDEKVERVTPESQVFALYPLKSWYKVRRWPVDALEASTRMTFDEFREYMQSRGVDIESPVELGELLAKVNDELSGLWIGES